MREADFDSKTDIHAALAAVTLSATFVIAKSFVWIDGNSTAMLSSLVDSVGDALISCTNLAAIYYARQPADHDHRYGHGKMEGIAALGQAAFIIGSCVFVVLEAIRKLVDPVSVENQIGGIWVLVLASIATWALTRFQAMAARKTGSLAVKADAAHYTGDVAVNIAVIGALAADYWLGWARADGLLAIGVAGWLSYTAYKIGREAVDMLLDREVDDTLRGQIRALVMAQDGVEGYHDLRTRLSGRKLLVSCDLEVDNSLSLQAAHAISKRVEQAITGALPHAEVMIHIDPSDDITDSRHQTVTDVHRI